MANKNLFKSASISTPIATARNHAGGRAYALPAEEALAQFAVTGCLNGTYYASAQSQLDTIIGLAKECSNEVIADVAIYARRSAHMKDMPALLLAILAGRGMGGPQDDFRRAARVVLDNGRMVRNFCQMIRSGKFGRKSFGTAIKREVRRYLQSAQPEQLFRDSVGNDPSLSDVIKMVRPKPANKPQDALFSYLIDSNKAKDKVRYLPAFIKEYEAFKRGGPMPEHAPFMMLTAHATGENAWLRLLQRASWTETRINLNAFNRHGALNGEDVQRMVADRIRNPELIRKARALPYQLMTAYKFTTDVPATVRNALQDAMEVATANVPDYGSVVVGVDISNSMDAPVTGDRGSATTMTSCKDAAALVASCVLRTSKNPRVIPFHTESVRCDLNPRDSVMTNAAKLASLPSGGTACSAPLKTLNAELASANLVIIISDNESWADPSTGPCRASGLMDQWKKFKQRNPKAKLVLMDMTPNTTSQAAVDKDILRVGGFSDAVFDVIEAFRAGDGNFLDYIRRGSDLTTGRE